MVGESNVGQFQSWLKQASPDDLVTITPALFTRIGTLDQRHQDRLIEEVKSDPQAKTVFDKMKSYAH